MKKITFYIFVVLVACFATAEQTNAQKLWGMTRNGGAYMDEEKEEPGGGVIFYYDLVTEKQTVVYSFNVTDGRNPEGSLMKASNGKLYGMTVTGGTHNLGVLFEYDPVTDNYVMKFGFDGTNGSHPYGGLIEVAGKLYGMTREGGSYGKGIIFEYVLSTEQYTKRHDFDGTNGATPYGDLLKASNGKLYGMTYEGGTGSFSGDYGVIFEFDPTLYTYSKKYDFEYGRGIYTGARPYGNLIEGSDGRLYGFTSDGGPDVGVIFAYILPDVTNRNGIRDGEPR